MASATRHRKRSRRVGTDIAARPVRLGGARLRESANTLGIFAPPLYRNPQAVISGRVTRDGVLGCADSYPAIEAPPRERVADHPLRLEPIPALGAPKVACTHEEENCRDNEGQAHGEELAASQRVTDKLFRSGEYEAGQRRPYEEGDPPSDAMLLQFRPRHEVRTGRDRRSRPKRSVRRVAHVLSAPRPWCGMPKCTRGQGRRDELSNGAFVASPPPNLPQLGYRSTWVGRTTTCALPSMTKKRRPSAKPRRLAHVVGKRARSDRASSLTRTWKPARAYALGRSAPRCSSLGAGTPEAAKEAASRLASKPTTTSRRASPSHKARSLPSSASSGATKPARREPQ